MFLYKIKKNFMFIFILVLFLVHYNNIYALGKEKDNKQIKEIIIDNKVFNNKDNNIILDKDIILVSAKDILEPFGIFVDINLNNKEIYLAYKNNIITLYLDKDIANINNNIVFIKGTTKIMNKKLMVPLESILENLGLDFKYICSSSSKNDFPPIIEENLPNNQNNKNPEDFNNKDKEFKDKNNKETIYTDKEIIKIKNLIIPKENEKYLFKIEVEGNLNKIEKSIIDNNKLAIDIYNGLIDLKNTNYTIENNFLVKKIKFDTITIDSKKVVRAIFDLKTVNDYSVNISEDKKYIEIKFEENKINKLTVNSDGKYDYIILESSLSPFYYTYIENDLLITNIYNANIKDISKSINSGKFISNTNITENNGLVKITSKVDKVIVSSSEYNNKLTIKLEEATYKNIDYIKNNNTIVLNKNPNYPINIESIIKKDNYNDKKYILNLLGDFKNIYGYGEFVIYNDKFLKSINIETIDERTIITLNENKIIDIDITEDDSNIYIKILSPKEKYPKILLLDPGHGGKDTGTRNPNNKNIIEKNIALDISNKVLNLFENNKEIKAYATRTEDVFIPLQDRAELGNEISDLFVSIHLNSTPVNFSAVGTETYYCNHDEEKNFNIKRKEIAKIFQNNIVKNLGTKDRGVKTASFVVLKNTNVPSILIELGFLSNNEEAYKFNTEEFQEKCAEVIYKSILETFKNYKTKRK